STTPSTSIARPLTLPLPLLNPDGGFKSSSLVFSNNMPMTSSSSSLSSSVVREGCTPSNPRTGELGSSPSLSGLRLPPPPSTDGSIVPLPAYSPAPVSVLAPAPPKTFPARQSIDPSPPRFGEARLKLRPWVGLVRARPTSTPAPGLWSTPSCSGIT
ncbi:hypothetical protein EDB83DRAFT_2372382, partial [Lactarius deliciosus]